MKIMKYDHIKFGKFTAPNFLNGLVRWREMQVDGLQYYISEAGNIYSAIQKRVLDGKAKQLRRKPYVQVRLGISTDKKGRRRYSINKLVMLAFGPPPGPSDHVVRFLDGDTNNCHISNLVWTRTTGRGQPVKPTGQLKPTNGHDKPNGKGQFVYKDDFYKSINAIAMLLRINNQKAWEMFRAGEIQFWDNDGNVYYNQELYEKYYLTSNALT